MEVVLLQTNNGSQTDPKLSSQCTCTCLYEWVSPKSHEMGTQGSLKYYENRDPGPHFPMKMGTRGPQFRGSPFSYDTCTGTVAMAHS